jgi:hypothetical protein
VSKKNANSLKNPEVAISRRLESSGSRDMVDQRVKSLSMKQKRSVCCVPCLQLWASMSS